MGAAAVRVMGWLPTVVSALSRGDLFPVGVNYSSVLTPNHGVETQRREDNGLHLPLHDPAYFWLALQLRNGLPALSTASRCSNVWARADSPRKVAFWIARSHATIASGNFPTSASAPAYAFR